jgi:type II secretory pathway pseudopilin PulG
LAAAQWILYAPKIIANFLDAKGPDLIVTTVGTLFAFGTAIWIYWWQVDDDKQAERRQAVEAKQAEINAIQRRRLDHILWLISVLKQISNYAKDQAEEMDSFVQAIKREPSEVQQLARIASFATQRLSRPDNEPTFHAYYAVFADDPDKDKHYGELLATADYVIGKISLVLETFQRYLENLYNRQLSLKAMLEQFTNDLAIVHMMMSPGGAHAKHKGSALEREINNWLLFHGTLIKKGTSIKESVNNYVKPVLIFLMANRHFPGFYSLIMQAKNINVAFTDFLFESENFEKAFDSKEIRGVIDKLDTARGRLENGYNSADVLLSRARSRQ